jgi:hypothetical protein
MQGGKDQNYEKTPTRTAQFIRGDRRNCIDIIVQMPAKAVIKESIHN